MMLLIALSPPPWDLPGWKSEVPSSMSLCVNHVCPLIERRPVQSELLPLARMNG